MKRGRRKTDKVIPIGRWLRDYLYYIILFAAALFTVLILITSCRLGRNSINSEKNAVFGGKWQYSIDETNFQAITLPFIETSDIQKPIMLKNRLPDKLAKGATVLLRTSQQDIKVYVENLEIYSSLDIGGKRHAPASAYHFVRLPIDGAGKEITVVLSSSLERYAGMMNEIYIGSKASHIFYLFETNGLRFSVGLFIFCVGFLLAVVFLFARGQKGKNSVVYLGGFFACAGLWLAAESHMVQFIFPYPMAVTNISIFALTLLPVFLGLYYYSSHEKVFTRLGRYIISGMAAASFGLAVCSCINPMQPLIIFPFYLVFLGGYVVVVLLLLFAEGIRQRRFFSPSICGGLALGFFCLLELVYYLSNEKSYNKSNFLTIGLLIFCILMIADAIQNFAKVYKEAVKVRALTVLAYTDSLTGLKNRTAFLERISELSVKKEGNVTLAMFDINNLKPVNDTLGHLVGDAMLRHSVKAIKASIRENDELYRIGGDEFAAIICHKTTLDVSALEGRLVDFIEAENKKPHSYQLSVAYGYATFSSENDKTFFDTLAKADEKMYACKRLQKESLE